jgi:small redox-active disulfide protein 2
MIKIEVLGTGCPSCQATMSNAEAAVSQVGIQAELVKVYDISEITARGVMMTPALVVDGVVRMAGKVPTVDEIKELLESKE